MRRFLTVSTTAVALLVLGRVASAEPAVGIGPAETFTGFGCYVAMLASGPQVTPLYPGTDLGLVLIPLENSRSVYANSANANLNLSCYGPIEFGSTVAVFDPVTYAPIGTATLATSLGEACAALEPVYPGVCRGNGAALITTGSTGTLCNLGGGVFTSNHRTVISPSGEVVLSCHYPD
jgi:hypothetical protein